MRRVVADDTYRGGPLRPTPLCVRCGIHARVHETFLCGVCLADPKTRQELRRIERGAAETIAQRRIAIERFHWAGGWGSRR